MSPQKRRLEAVRWRRTQERTAETIKKLASEPILGYSPLKSLTFTILDPNPDIPGDPVRAIQSRPKCQ